MEGVALRMANDWLDALEEKVRAAGERIQQLRSENQRLSERVEELEAQLADSSADAADGGWTEEREEIRIRVEKLTQGLEELMEI